MQLIYLPATEPGDTTYGHPPQQIEGRGDLDVAEVRYAHMVWYNERVRAEAQRQIDLLAGDRVILVGFSKSGLGAWHLASALRQPAAATIIFDAPVAHQEIPVQWGAAPFYDDVGTWRQDLPIHRIRDFRQSVAPDHRLILIAGAHFDADMVALSGALDEAHYEHTFLRHPEIAHHWNSGWLGFALAAL